MASTPPRCWGVRSSALFAFDTGEAGLFNEAAPLDGRGTRLVPTDAAVRLAAAVRHDGMGGIAGLIGATYLVDRRAGTRIRPPCWAIRR
jgi:hypothetical protein